MVLGKRLRKKIKTACGLDGLSRDEQFARAREIIKDREFKQKLCLKYPGVTHKDINRTMKAVLANKQPQKNSEEELYPEKYGIESQENLFNEDAWLQEKIPINETKNKYEPLTREETKRLVNASKTPTVNKESNKSKEYSTWTREEVAALIDGNYNPEHFKYLRKKNK